MKTVDLGKYLGGVVVPVEQTPFAEKNASDWALYYVSRYGGYDGAHHKDWVMDQVAQILQGTPVIIEQARWEKGHTEWRVTLGKPSASYLKWVDEITRGQPENYSKGIAP